MWATKINRTRSLSIYLLEVCWIAEKEKTCSLRVIIQSRGVKSYRRTKCYRTRREEEISELVSRCKASHLLLFSQLEYFLLWPNQGQLCHKVSAEKQYLQKGLPWLVLLPSNSSHCLVSILSENVFPLKVSYFKSKFLTPPLFLYLLNLQRGPNAHLPHGWEAGLHSFGCSSKSLPFHPPVKFVAIWDSYQLIIPFSIPCVPWVPDS